MQGIVSFQSHKGGVGKTLCSLLLARYATSRGYNVCLVDLDIGGAGLGAMLPDGWGVGPGYSIADFITSADPHDFDMRGLVGSLRAPGGRSIRVALSSLTDFEGPSDTDAKALSVVADEPQYREVETRLPLLFDHLATRGVDLIILDCPSGLGGLSTSVRRVSCVDVYVSTPFTDVVYGLLKRAPFLGLDDPKSVLMLNMDLDCCAGITAYCRMRGINFDSFGLKYFGVVTPFASMGWFSVLDSWGRSDALNIFDLPFEAKASVDSCCSKILTFISLKPAEGGCRL